MRRTRLARPFEAGTISDAGRRRVLLTLVNAGRSDLYDSARSLVTVGFAGDDLPLIVARLRQWAARAWAYVKGLRLAGLQALLGPGPLDSATLALAAATDRLQRQFFDRFMKEIRAGLQSPGGIPARLALYASAVWAATVNIERILRARSGSFTQERAKMSATEHCDSCLARARKGWQPIGTLAPLGDSECKANCRCRFEYRR